MYQLVCSSCGEKVTVRSFLNAAKETCSNCGKPVMEVSELPPNAMTEGPPRPERSRRQRSRVAKEWEKRGMIAGGIIGACCIALVGAVGGALGPPIVGAVGGALAGILLGGLNGVVRGAWWGFATGDTSWLSFWTILEVTGGAILGIVVGARFQHVTVTMLTLGTLGGAILGVIGGLVIGGVMGLRTERQAGDRLETVDAEAGR